MNNNEYHNLNRVSLIAKAQGAFLGAAVGDALGWPQEMASNRVDKKTGSPQGGVVRGFQQWVRKPGGKYYSHEEVILAGEYSDDTQLLLSTARSLLYGERWWHHFTKRELPTWTRYERGGGGATKRAAQEWLTGREPWSSPEKEKKQYFDAGGNGVAMRILPHCLLDAATDNFAAIAKNIVANGVCTHGHPRALVGALAYGFAVWVAFRETSTLQYGAIIEKVLSGVNFWSALPDLDNICPTWRHAAREVNPGQYDKLWDMTVEEMLQLLEQCREAMKQGALQIDREVLTKIGCFGSIKGAGTVSAAASIFIASRYAANPFHGILEAAFADGCDTDTIASMTGGILGAVAGIEWLGDCGEQVQDARYIRALAQDIARKEMIAQGEIPHRTKTTRADLDLLIEKLEASKPGDTVLLTDGRQAQTSAPHHHRSLSPTTQAVSWKVTTADGQSLYIKKLSRTKAGTDAKSETSSSPVHAPHHEVEFSPVEAVQISVRLLVRDLAKAQLFYENALGLKITESRSGTQGTKPLVNLSGVIVLEPLDYEKSIVQQPPSSTPVKNCVILVKTPSLEAAYKNVERFGTKILKPISQEYGKRYFLCLDPDGNTVEIFSEHPSA